MQTKSDLPAHSGRGALPPARLPSGLGRSPADGRRECCEERRGGLGMLAAFPASLFFYLFEIPTLLIFTQHHVEEDGDGGLPELGFGDEGHL